MQHYIWGREKRCKWRTTTCGFLASLKRVMFNRMCSKLWFRTGMWAFLLLPSLAPNVTRRLIRLLTSVTSHDLVRVHYHRIWFEKPLRKQPLKPSHPQSALRPSICAYSILQTSHTPSQSVSFALSSLPSSASLSSSISAWFSLLPAAIHLCTSGNSSSGAGALALPHITCSLWRIS